MATSLRENIILNVKAKLQAVTVANGYEQNLHVDRPAKSSVEEFPNVMVVDRGDQQQWHLRGAYNNRMTLELVVHAEKGEDGARMEALSDLMADVEKAVMADETWTGLARRTFITGKSPDISEVSEPVAEARITVEIVYRPSRTNPYVQQMV